MWKSVILWQRCLRRTGCHPAQVTPRHQQLPAPPPHSWDEAARGRGVGSGEGVRGVGARENGASCCEALRLPDCEVPGGIMECHPASAAAGRWHFIYQLTFFVNYKYFFLMAESKCHLSSGALEWWVVDGLGLLLWAFAFEMPLKTLDILQCRLSARVISNCRKMKKPWTLDENEW